LPDDERPRVDRDFEAARRGFFAAVERVDVERLPLALADFARVVAGFLAVLVFRAVLLRAVLFRPLVERFAPVLREAVEAELVPSSADHLPDITRCAASATASAIRVPSLVALAITLVAACEAVSAASSPASRIALRAFGLALIAAAAAASPAASISLLIAALASLSTVVLPLEEEPEEPRLEDLARADLAIASSPSVWDRHFQAVTVPE
jgi:hypothetical protein